MQPPPLLSPLLPPSQQSRIDVSELKSQIAKLLGPERAQLYFSYLNRLLSQKLSKSEFNKLCLSTLGRENIPLHNQLIRSILKNAFQAKVPPPPPPHNKGVPKPAGAVEKSSPQRDNGVIPPPAPAPAPALLPPVWSNGDILPPSPRRCRSGVRDRRIKDRHSPLGPNGRVDGAAHQPLPPHSESVITESSDLDPCDLKRPVQNQQGGSAEQPSKRLRIEKSSPQDQASVNSKGLMEVAAVEDGENVERKIVMSLDRGPLHAPLGIPFCPASVGGARRPLPLQTSACGGGSYDSGSLIHTEALRKRMEAIAEAHGLGGVTMDSANLLNNGLNAYLKRLIRSCFQLVASRSGHEPTNQLVKKQQQPHGKPINGVWLGNNNMHVQSSVGPSEGAPEPRNNHYKASLQDFKVAMELNPQQLGEDWPLLLEKICLSSFEE